MILGVTGLIGSGKGAVADILVKHGFEILGHSEIIAEELRRRNLPVIRDNLVAVGNEMRKKYGNDYWAKRLIEKIDASKNYVVEGFRSLGEIEAFKKIPNFILIGVAAGKSRRLSWILNRARSGDPTTTEEFHSREKKDFLQSVPEGQQNALCFSSADRFILNEGSLEDLEQQVLALLAEFKE